MSVDLVKGVIARFITDKEPSVLVIKGDWGVGKTHAWETVLQAEKSNVQFKKYSYVSLFGLKTISELRIKLMAKAIPTNLVGKEIDFKSVNSGWWDLKGAGLRKMLAAVNANKSSIPILKDIAVPFDGIASLFMQDCLVCLDDWERANFAPEDLLGLISELKVERKCKVILIFNHEKLKNHSDTYDEYREKVVDVEVVYAPTSKEAIAIGMASGSSNEVALGDKLGSLGITNIRLIRKACQLLNLLDPYIKKVPPNVKSQIISTAALLTWVYYGPKDAPGKPTAAFVRKWNSLGYALRAQGTSNQPTEEEQRWADRLNGYGYWSTDELDLAVDEVISRGYPEGTSIEVQIRAAEARARAAEREGSLEKAWDLFHRSFENNEQALVKALEDGLKQSIETVSPLNLNGTINLLRQLNSDALADELIEYFISARANDVGAFDLDSSAFGLDVTDQKIRLRFAQTYKSKTKFPTLFEAVTSASKNHAWSREAEQVMKNAAAEDFYNFIIENAANETVTQFAAGCAFMASVGGWDDFRAKWREALGRIASTSRLNAIRVRRFGYKPPESASLSDSANPEVAS